MGLHSNHASCPAPHCRYESLPHILIWCADKFQLVIMDLIDNLEDFDGDLTTILTAPEVLLQGLMLGHFTELDVMRANADTNERRFTNLYGCQSRTCAAIWETLHTTQVVEAVVPPEKRIFKWFLMSLHHLKKYPTELDRESMFGVSESWGRKQCWYFVEKIRALKSEKIVWPEDFGDDDWCISVDGTHFKIEEPRHPVWSQDRRYFSHKLAHAGLDYELGISLWESKLVWMNGPFPAGENDISIFVTHGLKDKLRAAGKRAIGDLGYRGHPNAVSVPNPSDGEDVTKFKSRALKRHEAFNGMIKTFESMKFTFRHSIKRFADCFEAICVICQFKLETEVPLFSILIEDVVNPREAEE